MTLPLGLPSVIENFVPSAHRSTLLDCVRIMLAPAVALSEKSPHVWLYCTSASA